MLLTLTSPVYEDEVYNFKQSVNAHLADVNGDGKADLFVGTNERPGVLLLTNTGFAPYFHPGGDTIVSNGLMGCSHPWLVDIDEDNDLDLLLSGKDGSLLLFRNFGSESIGQCLWRLITHA